MPPSTGNIIPFHFSFQKLDIGLELVRKGYAVELPEDMEENRAIPDMLHNVVSTGQVLLQGGAALRDRRASGHTGCLVEGFPKEASLFLSAVYLHSLNQAVGKTIGWPLPFTLASSISVLSSSLRPQKRTSLSAVCSLSPRRALEKWQTPCPASACQVQTTFPPRSVFESSGFRWSLQTKGRG